MENVRKYLSAFDSVVITGGSSGIGNTFIAMLHKLDSSLTFCNLSRTKSQLIDDLAEVEHFAVDISEPLALENAIVAILERENLKAGKLLVINNSGFGSYGDFMDSDLSHQLNMIDVNVRGLVQITGRFLPLLRRRGGAIVNIASTAAWQPTPYMAIYGASKAFVLNWSLALAEELRPEGVDVLCCCPGPTESNFFRRAGFAEAPISGWGHTAEQVVGWTLRALARRQPLVVTGAMNRIMVAVASRLPRVWQAPLSRMVLRRMRLDKMKPGVHKGGA